MLQKPKKRTTLRVTLGKWFYTWKRYLEWIFSGKKYAKTQVTERLDHVIFSHQTPLYRKLKDVDMWLQHNKVKNLEIAIQTLNGLLLKPGETFSYWKRIGRTTKAKGYVPGMVLYYGKYTTGIGGGLCQLSNLIYWMTLHTPLQVTERYRHSYDVFPDSKRTQPFGSGATCSYNYIDLQFVNNTDKTFQLALWLEDGFLKGEWRANEPLLHTYEVYEKSHWISMEYWGGYARHNEIYRKKLNQHNVLVDDEFITENHAIMMYEPLLEESKESSGG
ncbi:VanW family protein [Bacillus carboniphilus]|uniref:VanW family protein n=1 Tax=Bacillus carboniphilus TaxID=86663 RepID=A0ABN0WIV4_9BACI